MDEKTNDYEIPYLEPKLFYGLSTTIKENAIFVNDVELLHPAGKILVIDNLNNGKQSFIKVPLSKKKITGIIISPNRWVLSKLFILKYDWYTISDEAYNNRNF